MIERSRKFTVIYWVLVCIGLLVVGLGLGYLVPGELSIVLSAIFGSIGGNTAALWYAFGNPFKDG